MAEDSAPATQGPDTPRLLLRCEAGRVAAYVVVGPTDVEEPQPVDTSGVAVRLDSAPAC